MIAVEIDEEVSALFGQAFNGETFAYSFLRAFGNKETTIKRLKSRSSNKSDIGGVLQTNNIHIKVSEPGTVTETLTALKQSQSEICAGNGWPGVTGGRAELRGNGCL